MSDSEFNSLIATLAPAIHEHYRAQSKREGWTIKYDVPYADLPPDFQSANLAAARRIPGILEKAGLKIVSPEVTEFGPGDVPSEEETRAVLEKNIEAAAIADHEGWMADKIALGWQYGLQRDDEARLHPSLVPYEDLSEVEKEKDRSAVRNYPAVVRRAGLGIRFSEIS